MIKWRIEKPVVVTKVPIILATCYKCGRKFDIRTMKEVGNDVWKCSECIQRG